MANTIAIDLPGHGGSEGPALDSIPALAEAVRAFLQEIKATRPILCGLSMGSAIVLQYLLDYPDSAVAGIAMGAGARLNVAPLIFQTIAKDYAGFVALMGRLAFSPSAKPEAVQEISQLIMSCPPEVTAADFTACHSFDVLQRVEKIEHPLLIISGQEDKMTPPKYAEFLEKQVKRGILYHLLGTGHMIPNEKPLKVNKLIGDFIKGFL